MVTKQDCINATHRQNFIQTRIPTKQGTYFDNGRLIQRYDLQTTTECKPINWRVNGKCKTWKTRPDDFSLPIKHGLRDYGYITQDNCHLFILQE